MGRLSTSMRDVMDIVMYSVPGWEGLYVDGKLNIQDHSGTLEQFLNDAKFPVTINSITYMESSEALFNFAMEVGCFPGSLKEIENIG